MPIIANRLLAASLAIIALPAMALHAQVDATPPASSRAPEAVAAPITSLGLFKNGLAVVTRTIEAPSDGLYEIADLPEPVHGTFWIESDAKVRTRITRREQARPAEAPFSGDFQSEFADRQVTIHLHEPGAATISGKVLRRQAPDARRSWDRDYQPDPYSSWNGGGANGTLSAPNRYLVLETPSGRAYLDVAAIEWVETQGQAQTLMERRPVLEFAVSRDPKAPNPRSTITVSYLSKGVAWAPAYRVDLSDPKSMRLTQQAVIKNEMADFSDAEVFLISGFPSVEFGHVTSPISPATGLADFFTQLGRQGGLRHYSRGDVVTQQAVMMNAPGVGGDLDLSAVPGGDQVDLHYQSVGRLTMSEGDSIMLQVAGADAAYDRIIEWIVPDARDAYGREIDRYQQPNGRTDDDVAWDAVRFRNPFGFPMTTAPAMVVSGGRFNGQRISTWADRGEQACVRVNKALSLRTVASEREEEGRETASIGGSAYWRITVGGELVLNNHRNAEITVVIRRRFSGKLIEAAESPKAVLLEDGVYSVNERNELNWSIMLKPGEERKLTYRYTVLARH